MNKEQELRNILREALDEYLAFYHDAGPAGEGWKSDALEDFIARAERALQPDRDREPHDQPIVPWDEAWRRSRR